MRYVEIYFTSAGEGRFAHNAGDGWRGCLDLSEPDDFQIPLFYVPTLTEQVFPITLLSGMAKREKPLPDPATLIRIIEANMVSYKKLKIPIHTEACEDVLRRLRAMTAPPARARTRRLAPLPRHLSLVVLPEVANGAAA